MVLLVLLAASAGYAAGVLARRRRGMRAWPARRTASFLVGLALLGAAAALHGDGHDARGHMVQHLLLGMFAPLALVLGAPVTLLLGTVPLPARRRLAAALARRPVHLLAHPAPAALLNIGGLYLLYLTPLYAAAMHRPVLAAMVSVHFLLAGLLFAWSVAGPDPGPRRPGISVRVAVLVVAAAGHAYLAKLLYARAPTLPPGSGHTADDVRAAAQWMYYGGDVAELLLAAAPGTGSGGGGLRSAAR